MSSRASRAARGWAVGSVSMLIAAVSHDLGGGEFPGWLALLVGTVFAGILGMLITSARRSRPRASLPRMTAIVLVSQAAFHYLFSWLGSPTPLVADHVHAAVGATGAAGSGAGADSLAHVGHLTDPPMLAAHLVAAVTTIGMLALLESSLWRLLVELALIAISRMLPELVVMTPPSSRLSPVDREPRRFAMRVVTSVASRRGPPVLSFA